MKRIIMNEFQLGCISEARMDGFRLDSLRDMSFAARVRYCKQWLGDPIGVGSSRVVFQIDDESVLKLAKNMKGIAQNEKEYDSGNDYYICDLFPRVLNGSDSENFMWVVSEYVLPAKRSDFKQCLHVDYSLVMEFIRAVCNDLTSVVRKIYDENQNNWDFVDFMGTIEDYVHGYDNTHGDTQRLSNWGLAMRDGKPTLVLLDSGVNDEILRQYYRRW